MRGQQARKQRAAHKAFTLRSGRKLVLLECIRRPIRPAALIGPHPLAICLLQTIDRSLRCNPTKFKLCAEGESGQFVEVQRLSREKEIKNENSKNLVGTPLIPRASDAGRRPIGLLLRLPRTSNAHDVEALPLVAFSFPCHKIVRVSHPLVVDTVSVAHLDAKCAIEQTGRLRAVLAGGPILIGIKMSATSTNTVARTALMAIYGLQLFRRTSPVPLRLAGAAHSLFRGAGSASSGRAFSSVETAFLRFRPFAVRFFSPSTTAANWIDSNFAAMRGACSALVRSAKAFSICLVVATSVKASTSSHWSQRRAQPTALVRALPVWRGNSAAMDNAKASTASGFRHSMAPSIAVRGCSTADFPIKSETGAKIATQAALPACAAVIKGVNSAPVASRACGSDTGNKTWATFAFEA